MRLVILKRRVRKVWRYRGSGQNAISYLNSLYRRKVKITSAPTQSSLRECSEKFITRNLCIRSYNRPSRLLLVTEARSFSWKHESKSLLNHLFKSDSITWIHATVNPNIILQCLFVLYSKYIRQQQSSAISSLFGCSDELRRKRNTIASSVPERTWCRDSNDIENVVSSIYQNLTPRSIETTFASKRPSSF